MPDQIQELIGKWVHVRSGASTVYGIGGAPTDCYGILTAVDDMAMHVRQPNGETIYVLRKNVRRIAEMTAPPEGDAGRLLRPAEGSALPLLRPAESKSEDAGALPRLVGYSARLVPKRFRRG